MASNLKALLDRATPMSEERAEEVSNAHMAANQHRYRRPLPSAECLEEDGLIWDFPSDTPNDEASTETKDSK